MFEATLTDLHSKLMSSLQRPCLKITTNQTRKSRGRVTGLHSQTARGCKPVVLFLPYGMVFWVPIVIALVSELMLLLVQPSSMVTGKSCLLSCPLLPTLDGALSSKAIPHLITQGSETPQDQAAHERTL